MILAQVIQHSKIKTFADDVKLYRGISSLGDMAVLQDDLNASVNWCNLNSVTFNQGKCHVVNYPVNAVAYQYSIGENVICSVDSIRDLGIVFDNQLRFDKQELAISCKANYSLLCIRRRLRRFNLQIFTKLCKAMLQPTDTEHLYGIQQDNLIHSLVKKCKNGHQNEFFF